MKTKALRVRRDFYELVFHNTLDGLAYCQMFFDAQQQPVDFRYIMVNKNFETLTGLTGAEGKKVTELIPEIRASNPELFEIYGRVASTGKTEKFETHIESLARWFSISAYSPQRDFFVAIFQDITKHKQIEKDLENAKIAARNVLDDLQDEKNKLTESEKKYHNLIDVMNEGLLAHDSRGIITFMNRRGCEVLGYTAGELMGKPLTIVFDEENQKILQEQMAKRKREEHQNYEITWLRKDGGSIPAIVAPSPHFDERGNLLGSVVVFTDITERKRVDRRLQEIDKAKTEFISTAAHQLRTPVTEMRWLVESLQVDPRGFSQQQQQYLSDIATSTERLTKLVEDLLNVSRIELGTLPGDVRDIDVNTYLEHEVCDPLRTYAETTKHTIVFQGDTAIRLIVHMNVQALSIITNNLLANAINYSPDGTPVTVQVQASADSITILVHNEGVILSKEQEKLFQKFYRGETARKKKPEGSGLGLYLVKELVTRERGSVSFTSRQSEGTTFQFTLPRKSAIFK